MFGLSTSPIARTSTRLDFTSDPADEIIAATSVVHGVPSAHARPRSAQLNDCAAGLVDGTPQRLAGVGLAS